MSDTSAAGKCDASSEGNASESSTDTICSGKSDVTDVDDIQMLPTSSDSRKATIRDEVSRDRLAEKPAKIPLVRKLTEPSTSSAKSSEINYYLHKLRGMVPFKKSSPKLSKVELIHSAIDYITDLQESLEAKVKRSKTDASCSTRPPFTNLCSARQFNCEETDNPQESHSLDYLSHNTPTESGLQMLKSKSSETNRLHKEHNPSHKSSIIEEIDKYFEENLLNEVLSCDHTYAESVNVEGKDSIPKCDTTEEDTSTESSINILNDDRGINGKPKNQL